jgi:hypothetical protein
MLCREDNAGTTPVRIQEEVMLAIAAARRARARWT